MGMGKVETLISSPTQSKNHKTFDSLHTKLQMVLHRADSNNLGFKTIQFITT